MIKINVRFHDGSSPAQNIDAPNDFWNWAYPQRKQWLDERYPKWSAVDQADKVDLTNIDSTLRKRKNKLTHR